MARAKARLADEYDAAQKRGEVAGVGQYERANVGNANVSRATAADIGVRRDEIHEARQIRDAERAEPGITALDRLDQAQRSRSSTLGRTRSHTSKALSTNPRTNVRVTSSLKFSPTARASW